MAPGTTKAEFRTAPIYRVLAEHQRSAGDWDYRPVLAELHTWAERFTIEFKLQIPQVVLAVDRTRVRQCLGHYRPGHNGLGLRCEIVLSDSHVRDCGTPDKWHAVLGTLLHEQLHCWQEFFGTRGSRNYHNKEFRQKAAGLGLLVDGRGVTQYQPGSLFFRLLEQHGVAIPSLPSPVLYKRRSASVKLHLWTCGCTKVRVGKSHFNAKCLDCGRHFELVE
jgi:hypothetical protein